MELAPQWQACLPGGAAATSKECAEAAYPQHQIGRSGAEDFILINAEKVSLTRADKTTSCTHV